MKNSSFSGFIRYGQALVTANGIAPFLCAMACCFFGWAASVACVADEPIVRADWIYDEAPFPECHASTLEETADGLIVAFFGGTYEKHPDVGIWVVRQQGKAWTRPVEVANGLQADGKRFPCWNPVLFSTRDKNTRQKDGSGKDPDEKGKASESSLWLFYKVGPSPDTWWGMVTKSDDGGKSWGKPERLPDGILGPIKNKPVLLGDDRLLCGSSTEHDGWKVHMEWLALSSNRWEKTPALAMGAARGAIQPTILQYGQGSDTRLQILCRSRGDGKILGSWSNDMGRTWTDLAAIQLPNPNSGIDGVTLRNGKQLLVYNHTPSGRSPLNVAWSTDGSAWHAGAILEHERGEYSYPAVIQTADGRVHITYTWKRQRVRHVELDPDKLASRPIVDGKWPE